MHARAPGVLAAAAAVAGLLACASTEPGATATEGSGSAGSGSAGSGSAAPGTSEGTSEGSGGTSGTGGTGDDLGAAGGCEITTPEALMACVDLDRYVDDLTFIAAPRTPGSPHWLAVQERCASALEEAGLVVELEGYGSGTNVIGVLPGVGAEADEVVLLGAHYDHIAACDGADDNASGVAGALEVARVLAAAPLRRTLVVACWDQEELGLVGSRAYAQALVDPSAVVVAFNFDMIGYADPAPNTQTFPGPLAARFPGLAAELDAHEHRADFIAVVADDLAEGVALDLEARAEGLGRLTGVMTLSAAEKLDEDAFGLLAQSDHRSFWERDVPALHVFDTGVFRNPAYHCFGGADTVDTLDHAFTFDVLRATVGAVAAAAALDG
ncbi:MAG: M28 family peptidase [Myxococcales bacterium]|nr:M28 family peptidase [Myxococcales bacterium]